LLPLILLLTTFDLPLTGVGAPPLTPLPTSAWPLSPSLPTLSVVLPSPPLPAFLPAVETSPATTFEPEDTLFNPFDSFSPSTIGVPTSSASTA